MKGLNQKLVAVVLLLVLLVTTLLPTGVVIAESEPVFTIEGGEGLAGQEVTIKLNLSNNSGLRVISGRLFYDADKLEFVSADLVGLQNADARRTAVNTPTLNAITFNASCSGELVPAMNDNGTIMTATFKIKENVSGTANLTLNNMAVGKDMSGKITCITNNGEINIKVPTTGVTLDQSQITLEKGNTQTLTATVAPAEATNKNVTWESSNPAIATVGTDGTVTAVAKGSTTITAKTADNYTATCQVTVTQPITGVTLNKTSLDLEKTATERLTATITPSNADGDKTITWESSNPAIATVGTDGTVTAVAKGSATITAKTSNNKTATCNVTVGVPLKGISFEDNTTQKTLNKSDSFTLAVAYDPIDTDADKTVTWTSSDTSVATVNGGVVTAVAGGESTITARVGKYSITCKVKVVVPLNSIQIKNATSIQYGQTEKLEVTYNPIDATEDKTISWSSADESIATVSTNGTVTAKGVGSTTITARTIGGKESTCNVTVLPIALNSIAIKEQNITLNKLQTKNLTVTYNPENTTESKNVTWQSADDTKVSVDANGKITAVGAGTTTITATVGTKTAQTTVTVLVPLNNISLSETEKTLNKNGTVKLGVTYDPVDTTDSKTVQWTSTNDAVASVDTNGNVTARKAGTAYIKAKVGNKEKSCKITVVVPLTGIELNKTTSQILKGQTDTLVAKLQPEDTTYKGNVTWESSDNTIATVDANGRVIGLKAGTATITAKAVEDGNEYTHTCSVTVEEIPLNSIAMNMVDFELSLGRTEQLGVVFNPPNTTDDRTIQWSSSDADVVSVNSNGVVTAKKEGTATITAEVGGKITTVDVTAIYVPITSISLQGTDTTVKLGSTINVVTSVNPVNASNPNDLTFISSNSDIIFVNDDGSIVAKGIGKAILTVETANGVRDQIEIEVIEDKDAETTNEETQTGKLNNSIAPKTGDIAIEMLITLMTISGIGIVMILKRNRRK